MLGYHLHLKGIGMEETFTYNVHRGLEVHKKKSGCVIVRAMRGAQNSKYFKGLICEWP